MIRVTGIRKQIVFRKKQIIKATRGAIAIFLAILMLPFVTIIGALISAARIHSAQTVFYESMSNAADSTLATCDSFLKKRFGLLAMKQGDSTTSTNETLTSTFNKYLQNNNNVLSNTYFNVTSDCKGMYSLADPNVLLNQILEYSKYSVPTKLVLDGFNVDDMIKNLGNLVPGSDWMNVISAGADLGGTFVELGNASDAYADASGETETAKGYYDTAYTEFEDSVSRLCAKIGERDRRISELNSSISAKETAISNKRSEVNRLNDADENTLTAFQRFLEIRDNLSQYYSGASLSSYQINQIDPYGLIPGTVERTVSAYREYVNGQLEQLGESLGRAKTAAEQLYQLQKDLISLQSTLESERTRFANEISTLEEEVNSDKGVYEQRIQEFISKLTTQKSKMTAYYSAIESAGSKFVDLASTTYDTLSSADKERMEELKKQGEKEQLDAQAAYQRGEITAEEYQDRLQQAQIKIRLSQEAANTINNQQRIAEATGTFLNDALEGAKDNLNLYNEAWYDSAISLLQALKEKVHDYPIPTDSGFSKTSFKQDYYLEINIVTKQMVEEAEKELVAEVTKSSIWDVITTLIDVLVTLIKMLFPYDPNLNSNLDRSYTDTLDWEHLEEGNDEDRELSEYYRQLFGSYSATDLTGDNAASFVDYLLAILDDLAYIKSNIAFAGIAKLVGFGNAWKTIEEKFSDLKSQFSGMLNWFREAVKNLRDKAILAGYLSYSTSCRTTYKSGKALTGASFNLRNQTGNLENGFEESQSIGDFVRLFSTAFTGDSAKCFVGAETEYLINGRDSEIANQLLTFLEVYGMRVVCNIYPVITSPEVAEIAAATTIGAPIVYIVYILLEPLIDCALLTNGGSCAIVKSQPYLVPSGLASLFKDISGVAASSAQISAKKQQFENAVQKFGEAQDNDSYGAYHIDVDQSENAASVQGKGYKLNYKNILFLYMMFCSTEKLVNRFRDIVEMEALQNAYETGGGSSWDGVTFDLSQSFTFIRATGSFKTNQFIRFSEDEYGGEDFLIYRGY